MVREYASDDGEPAGSAGKPISNVLQGEDLENVVCVVTRYYGGTDLGIGGLVRAYGNATKAAIDAADAVVERPHERVTVTAEYDDSGTVRAILESDYVEFDAAYEETVTFDIRVPTTDVEASATGYGAQRAGVRESNKGVGERRIEAADPGPKNGSNRSVSRDDTESRTSIGDRV
jgi:putative IMPACT (imprinted ancient) family translation regulator